MPRGKKRTELRCKLRKIYDKEISKEGVKREEAMEAVVNTKISVGEVYTFESLMGMLFNSNYGKSNKGVMGKRGG